MVGSAVGMRTVSSATRKIDMQSAVYARRMAREGRELAAGEALATMLSPIKDAEDFSVVSGDADDLTILTAESSVRDVCLEDRSDGMPGLSACSGPNLETMIVEFVGAGTKPVVEIVCAMM